MAKCTFRSWTTHNPNRCAKVAAAKDFPSLRKLDRRYAPNLLGAYRRRSLYILCRRWVWNMSILLHGPSGVGKTSLIESLTAAIGYHIVRNNLCEHSDLAYLFSTDLPATDIEHDATDQRKSSERLGSFVWRDGPWLAAIIAPNTWILLGALKAPNTWILLDEYNLASKSVLERGAQSSWRSFYSWVEQNVPAGHADAHLCHVGGSYMDSASAGPCPPSCAPIRTKRLWSWVA